MKIGISYYHRVYGVVMYHGLDVTKYGELHAFETERISAGKPAMIRTTKVAEFHDISTYTGKKPLQKAEKVLSEPINPDRLSLLSNQGGRAMLARYIVGTYEELLQAVAAFHLPPKYKASYSPPTGRDESTKKLLRVLSTATKKSESELIQILNVALKKSGREVLFFQ